MIAKNDDRVRADFFDNPQQIVDRLGGLAAGVRLASGKHDRFVGRKKSTIYVRLTDTDSTCDDVLGRLRQLVAMHDRERRKSATEI
jgi:hypothetical protein